MATPIEGNTKWQWHQAAVFPATTSAATTTSRRKDHHGNSGLKWTALCYLGCGIGNSCCLQQAVSDGNGNSQTCSRRFLKSDGSTSTIICPMMQTWQKQQCGKVVETLTLSVSSGNDGNGLVAKEEMKQATINWLWQSQQAMEAMQHRQHPGKVLFWRAISTGCTAIAETVWAQWPRPTRTVLQRHHWQ